MSANRSVQAAQRRQTKTADPPMPGRGPQPSINSSQMFAAGQQQQRMGPGSGQVSGRLAGQNAALAQKQMMDQQQQQQQQQQMQPQAGLGGINKMTLPQAITLITLRLGKVETQLYNNLSSGAGSNAGSMDQDEDHILVDKQVIQSLISRIEALEKKPATSIGANANQDISLLKQQFDTIKPIVVQSKTTNNVLKQQIEGLKTELAETKELITALQNLTMDNSNKILAFSSIYNPDGNADDMFLEDGQEEGEQDFSEDADLNVEEVSEEIVGTNLKELIEQEFNAEQ